MRVQLLAKSDKKPLDLASHAARVCYTLNQELIEKPIDVKARLFDSGHHTTLQHTNFTFYIQDVPVTTVMFGLHLTSPYYNSDQRSGRFSKMYAEPDFDMIRGMLAPFYKSEDIEKVLPFIETGAEIYREWLPKIVPLAEKAIKAERPFAGEKYIELNAPKLAQEQLRMFVSQVVPTALDTTLNLSALTALWRSAWTPELRALTDAMRDAVLAEYPELEGFFNPEARRDTDWFLPIQEGTAIVEDKPDLFLIHADLSENVYTNAGKDSVDTLYFTPEALENDVHYVHTRVQVSCATYGQDQRHRSVRRSTPRLTTSFYLPPLLKEAGMMPVAMKFMQEWLDLKDQVSAGLMQAITPYGAMVSYDKLADLNALIHEQGKRSCWCAQEEIYHLSVALREVLEQMPEAKTLVSVLAPPCFICGKCQEGARYCGRDIKGTPKDSYFPKRKV